MLKEQAECWISSWTALMERVPLIWMGITETLLSLQETRVGGRLDSLVDSRESWRIVLTSCITQQSRKVLWPRWAVLRVMGHVWTIVKRAILTSHSPWVTLVWVMSLTLWAILVHPSDSLPSLWRTMVTPWQPSPVVLTEQVSRMVTIWPWRIRTPPLTVA